MVVVGGQTASGPSNDVQVFFTVKLQVLLEFRKILYIRVFGNKHSFPIVIVIFVCRCYISIE